MSAAELSGAAAKLRDEAAVISAQYQTGTQVTHVSLGSRRYMVLDPVVASALADLLDESAWFYANAGQIDDAALAIARAYLGSES